MLNSKIIELLNEHKELSIDIISKWLYENKYYFNFLISETSCRKWNKWLNDKTVHLFPCVCASRDQDCIFIEMYYELVYVFKLNWTFAKRVFS